MNQRYLEATADVLEYDLAYKMWKDKIVKTEPKFIKYAKELNQKKAKAEGATEKKETDKKGKEEGKNKKSSEPDLDFSAYEDVQWLNTSLTNNVSPDLVNYEETKDQYEKKIQSTLEELYKKEHDLGTKPEKMSDEEWNKKVAAHKAEIQTTWHKLKSSTQAGFVIEWSLISNLAGIVGNDVMTHFRPIEINSDCGYMLGEFILFLREQSKKDIRGSQLMEAYSGADFANAMRTAFNIDDHQLFEYYQKFCEKKMNDIVVKQEAMRKSQSGTNKYFQTQFFAPVTFSPDSCVQKLSCWVKVGIDACRTVSFYNADNKNKFNLALIPSKDFDAKALRAVKPWILDLNCELARDSVFYDLEDHNQNLPFGAVFFITPAFNDLWFGLDTWMYDYHFKAVAYYPPTKKPVVRAAETGGLRISADCEPSKQLIDHKYVTGVIYTVVSKVTGDTVTLRIPMTDFKSDVILKYDSLGIDPTQDIDVEVTSRWFYQVNDSTIYYSPSSQPTQSKSKLDQGDVLVDKTFEVRQLLVHTMWHESYAGKLTSLDYPIEQQRQLATTAHLTIKADGTFSLSINPLQTSMSLDNVKSSTMSVSGIEIKGKGDISREDRDIKVTIKSMSCNTITDKGGMKRKRTNIDYFVEIYEDFTYQLVDQHQGVLSYTDKSIYIGDSRFSLKLKLRRKGTIKERTDEEEPMKEYYYDDEDEYEFSGSIPASTQSGSPAHS